MMFLPHSRPQNRVLRDCGSTQELGALTNTSPSKLSVRHMATAVVKAREYTELTAVTCRKGAGRAAVYHFFSACHRLLLHPRLTSFGPLLDGHASKHTQCLMLHSSFSFLKTYLFHFMHMSVFACVCLCYHVHAVLREARRGRRIL